MIILSSSLHAKGNDLAATGLHFFIFIFCRHEGGLFAVVRSKIIQLKLRVSQRNPSSTNKVLQTDRKHHAQSILWFSFLKRPSSVLLSLVFLDSAWSMVAELVCVYFSDIVTTMFVGNFIGIICARSLHYQFYSW